MNSRQVFENAVEANISRLRENYTTLLLKSQVKEEVLGHEHLQLQASAANIVHSCQCLLDQVQEIRLHILLQGPSAVLQETNDEASRLQKRLQAAQTGESIDENISLGGKSDS
mmetsp:Transcript_24814/g.42007  ORF Transcript_24814/g.42007 Transcript_24814/m.42007 type:complete len:113 (+) Transcript_24814:139-477(+)|eukprot:CAMPEP_0114424936 /NCGR_PEP_ID=MMETSP0103-20121206/6961_1 /TAXON_ID=37642 ORGANISM="Paraphysomonas imperforata, Strain PA2" /NCGR_SAMPLE_ID=MMETSP0103 /ASSEMBLY_ACC=CAM_ASM_000201 /LENGTH=112 /DNA_ID=CAMNT_0001593725 /DNA_START=40 /DNA_END=378 /DNA_ORIENTATION=+